MLTRYACYLIVQNGERYRKDPFASSKSNTDGSEGTIYGQAIGKTQYQVTIGVNIQNPHTFYYYSHSNYGYILNSTPYYNTWSAKNKDVYGTTATISDNTVIKTIYDPCPTGYTAPPANAFSKFTTKNWDNANKGHTLGGCWFPAVGYRASSSGALTDVGSTGLYWHAVPGGAGNGRSLYFVNGGAPTPAFNYNLSGSFAIRPVAEIEPSGN